MYARTTTIRGTSQAIDDATACMRDEVMPAVQPMDGFVGLSLLAGRCIVTTAWQTEEAMRATMDRVRPMRDRVAERSWAVSPRCRPGRSPSSTAWTRPRPARGYGSPGRASTHPGSTSSRTRSGWACCRGSRRWPASAVPACWSTAGRGQQPAPSRSRTARVRNRAGTPLPPSGNGASHDIGVTFDDVAEFELVLAHLRVPETV